MAVRLPLLFSAHEEEQQNQLDSLVESLTYTKVHSCLLAGPSRCGKTSLLFHYAYNYAAAHGEAVYFVAQRHKLQNQLPLPPLNMTQDAEVLKRIKMKYVEDDEKLCKFLASLQLLPRLPRLLVIDDVSSFVGDKDPKRIARVMAFIKEAATYAATKSRHFVLVTSDTVDVEASSRNLQLYQRWFDLILLIRGPHNPLQLTVESVHGRADPKGVHMYYELSPSYVYYVNTELDASAAAHE